MDAPLTSTNPDGTRRAEKTVGSSALGDWIRARRAGQGISQRELADLAGLSRSYLCDIERGRGTQPSIESLDRIGAALGADRTELLQVAGILEPRIDSAQSIRERRLIAVFRGLTDGGMGALERYARFLLSEEQHWVQTSLSDGREHRDERLPLQSGPSLFDVLAD